MTKIVSLSIGDNGDVSVLTKNDGDFELASLRVYNNITKASFVRLSSLCKAGKLIGVRAKSSTGYTSHVYRI